MGGRGHTGETQGESVPDGGGRRGAPCSWGVQQGRGPGSKEAAGTIGQATAGACGQRLPAVGRRGVIGGVDTGHVTAVLEIS